MSEQTVINYLDGDVVWVKLGGCWWPGEVVGPEKLPPDVLPSFRKPPIAVVKFYQEDTYEYVKNLNSIYKYNCSRKNEFINKGLYMYRTKHGQMDKFPEDVIRAETAVGGDITILTRDEFQEVKKESYAGLFGDPAKKTPASIKKGRSGLDRLSISSSESGPAKKLQEKGNYKVHILVQGSKIQPECIENVPSPSASCAESEPQDAPSDKEEKVQPVSIGTPTMSSTGIYACHACPFTTTRLNVLIMHNKTHSATFTPYTPSPIKKKVLSKIPKSTKTPKIRKPKQEKIEKPAKKKQGQKRPAEDISVDEVKRNKTDEEIKSSLLADWDDIDEESNDEYTATVMAGSPEVPVAAECPAVPTPVESPRAEVPAELTTKLEKKLDVPPPVLENPESVNDSKYEFCEDEDWQVETDIGRKIPRVKNPSKRRDETKSIDDDEMAREVAELLNKTTLPELPSAPEPLKVEENFPEPSIVKSPDKSQDIPLKQYMLPDNKNSTDTQPTKTIFKTKTFFRSRHSRSQDAIGKYVAEQLNAAERMDMTDNELNGSEVTSSPEPPRISTPAEHVKVARLAPKIQLKKMKAEAAQLLEQEKLNSKRINDDYAHLTTPNTEQVSLEVTDLLLEKETSDKISSCERPQKRYDPQTVVVNKDNQSQPVKGDSSTDIVGQIDVVPTIATNISYTAPSAKEAETFEPLMNESTASAVDALLSVSRETDRVTKVVSDDPPEDLFEDDNKESKVLNTLNGFSVESFEEKGQNDRSISECCKESSELVTLLNNQNTMDNIQENHTDISAIVKEIKPQENLQLIADVATVKSSTDEETTCFSTSDLPVNSNECLSSELIPIESVLQVAEALINLPTTSVVNKSVEPLVDPTVKENTYHILNKTLEENGQYIEQKNINSIFLSNQSDALVSSETENLNNRFETEQEKCENLNAAQSLVEMSESIELKINVGEVDLSKEEHNLNTSVKKVKDSEITSNSTEVGQNLMLTTSELNVAVTVPVKSLPFQTNPSKLLKILEEPFVPKVSSIKNPTIAQQVIVTGKEKILNFDVGQSPLKPKPAKQKIIIRRTTPTKNLLNNLNEITSSDKIILSPTSKSKQDASSVQTYTIQTKPKINSTESNTIVIQPKIRKIAKPVTKLQKTKSDNSIVTSILETKSRKDKSSTDNVFDINSMPVVLSDDILTPESIEKMPIVMSDGNIITGNSNPPKLLKTKTVHNDKTPIAAVPNKTDVKTLLVNPTNEGNKVTTPNILSKSAKLRGAKPMLVIDKTSGKQKFIMTKAEQLVKEIKQSPSILQSVPQAAKTEKFIILPTPHSPRPGRTQKIVINPQTGKAHVLVGKGPETTSNATDNKPVSAKLIPSTSDTSTPGNTVMIITNAQGAQSRIVLTPEHEKILFPNKQQQNITQLKQINYRPPNNGATPKTTMSTVAPLKTQTRIVQKQKNAIITSKGQLIVGSRTATTTQNIAPLPEIRPAPKRIIATEPKKLVQAIQKTATEQLIFLQQKSGAVMQLTVAQFEHLKRTGQIVQKTTPPPPPQEKIIIQKSITISPNETIVPTTQRQRVRKHAAESHTPSKKVKHEIAIAPAPAPSAAPQIPALTPFTNTTTFLPSVSNTNTISSTNYSDLDNFEELLPSTAIARQPEPVVQPEAPALLPPPAPVADGQLLAIPGENFGGPQGSFYLCVEDNGTLTPIDNRPLVLENNQLVPMAEPMPVLAPQLERRDILEAALANSDVFHAESTRDEVPDFRDLNANVSVHCRVSETSTTLNQPIMTPIEMPSKVACEPTTVPSNLEDGLAVIGVTPHTIPTSLELPITVTDPRIAPKNTNPLRNNNYGPPLLPSPNTELTFATREDTSVSIVGPISMPLLTEDDSMGKSMPILTDDLTDRTAPLVECPVASPAGAWPRRRAPGSDSSEGSAEIPVQPVLQVSANDLTQSS